MYKNYLNSVTSQSITRFSIDTAQQALEFLKKINDGQDVKYNSFSSEEDDDDEKVEESSRRIAYYNTCTKDKEERESIQKQILSQLKIDNINFKMIPNVVSYGKNCSCVIYNNPKTFSSMIIRDVTNKDYELVLHTDFVEKDYVGDYKIYYSLIINNQEDISNKEDIFKIKTDCREIITKYVSAKFQYKTSIIKMMQLVEKYYNSLVIHKDNTTNIEEILESINKDSENYIDSKTN